MSLQCRPSSFGSVQLTVGEEMTIKEFQDCRHGCSLAYQNETILAILNFHVSPYLSPSFGLIRITVREEMSFGGLFECRHGMISAIFQCQLNLTYALGRCGLKNFKMVAVAVFLDIGMKRLQQFWIYISHQCLPSSLGLIWLRVGEQMWF